MADQDLRSRLIRLAHAKPELRHHLLPLLREAGIAQVEVSSRTLMQGIHAVMAEYQEYGADPRADAVAAEALNALYGPWSERDLDRNLKGSFRDAYNAAKRLAAKVIDDYLG